MAKTVDEIMAEFSAKGPQVLNDYHARLDEIRAIRQPGDGAYLDRLTDEQRMELLLEQKTEQAKEAHEKALKDYTEVVESYHSALAKRKGYIKQHLFGVEDAGALSRAATATDAELGVLLDIAAQAGNAELGRAVFVAAEQRELGNLMHDYFEKINPEGRELYQEWSRLPPQEILKRQQNVDAILPAPNPDSLMPRATMVY